jgi:DNA mismatch endonuclease (patch repair protein)
MFGVCVVVHENDAIMRSRPRIAFVSGLLRRKAAMATRRKAKRPPMDRSAIMARIRARDTKPEIALRRALRSRGIGYRLVAKDLPGRPDVVFRGARLAVFVHGCFWHRHPGCRKATTPKSSVEFWQAKFQRNAARDVRNVRDLEAMGWAVGIVWECEVLDENDLALSVDAIELIVRPCPSSC